MPHDRRRRVSVLRPRRSALVLGSAEPNPFGHSASRGSNASWDLVRRRSGGGAVWLDPQLCTWIDVFVPAADPLWRADVGSAFGWLGKRLAQAFSSLGVQADVHEGAYEPGGLVCFASRGPGEVLVENRKLVGISQRRARQGSRFQCAWYTHFELGPLSELLDARTAALTHDRAIGWVDLGIDLSPPQLTSLVLRHITSPEN
ncbi:lipoyl protein ligase domain-containing protein [Candidatus Poriferisodalis sp.]|uniref:lipoyl protein ligase domain-containing protein n=1 Tax=Candidatus Poriferisodalis sp. TaxID=3101277 RepID=UPI003D0D1E56